MLNIGPKSPDFDFLTKTGLFRTGLSPDSIPSSYALFVGCKPPVLVNWSTAKSFVLLTLCIHTEENQFKLIESENTVVFSCDFETCEAFQSQSWFVWL